jgi:hypothetical protein
MGNIPYSFSTVFMLGFQPEIVFFVFLPKALPLETQRAASLALGWDIFGFQPKNKQHRRDVVCNVSTNTELVTPSVLLDCDYQATISFV